MNPPTSEAAGGELSRAEVQRLVSEGDFTGHYEELRDSIEKAIQPSERWAIVGIKRRGATLGRRLWKDLEPAHPGLSYGEVDISLYRDDYHLQVGNPRVLGTEIDFPVEGTSILLVDDVLFTGRTVRAAMDLLLDFGRPRRIWLAVFVDRGNRELPIAPDFVGYKVSTRSDERVVVLMKEYGDPVDAVDLLRGAGER